MAKFRFRNLYSYVGDRLKGATSSTESNSENVIDDDTSDNTLKAESIEDENRGMSKKRNLPPRVDKHHENEQLVKPRNPIFTYAYNLLGRRLPGIPQYKETYEQAGMPLVYEAYLSTGFFVAIIAVVPTFIMSFLLELKLLHHGSLIISVLGSSVLGGVVFATSLLLWLVYPIFRRRNFKSALENQLAYSFGILGVLAAAGMTLDRLFERIAASESNPVLAVLAKRFLRNVRLFGMDSESALAEVAKHSPSPAFVQMLDSIIVAYRTTGSIHNLVLFESSRLLQEKKDSLRNAISSLSIMAELYIALVVVGPIIFIVMLSIFGLLPSGGLPNPIFMINLIVFIGIPVLSIVFIILLDSVVGKV